MCDRQTCSWAVCKQADSVPHRQRVSGPCAGEHEGGRANPFGEHVDDDREALEPSQDEEPSPPRSKSCRMALAGRSSVLARAREGEPIHGESEVLNRVRRPRV